MPRTDILYIRLEGGQHDGIVLESKWSDPDDLPDWIMYEEQAYLKSMVTKLPPMQGIIRGATYIHRPDRVS